ncbi:carbohydrate-binding protein, partial [Streptomyces sp. WAC08241]|uniref:carbohydrate-binding protein n=1 Tax=Streptomyces sp. WAC08241 TaxID=2487421 RepID=UPI0021AE8617
YVAGQIYNAGNEVSHNGRKYKAKWWTQNEAPGTTVVPRARSPARAYVVPLMFTVQLEGVDTGR